MNNVITELLTLSIIGIARESTFAIDYRLNVSPSDDPDTVADFVVSAHRHGQVVIASSPSLDDVPGFVTDFVQQVCDFLTEGV